MLQKMKICHIIKGFLGKALREKQKYAGVNKN